MIRTIAVAALLAVGLAAPALASAPPPPDPGHGVDTARAQTGAIPDSGLPPFEAGKGTDTAATVPPGPPTDGGTGPGPCGPSGCISDIRAKHDIALVDRLPNGLGLYSYRYLWSDTVYVGVMAQEVAKVMPDAVVPGADGYLRVSYARLGMHLMTWDEWARDGHAAPVAPAAAVSTR
jgi:hypothetical protein